MHQTSKLSRCLKQIKLQIMEHLRETMHCNVAKVFLDAHLKSRLYKNKAWISLDISEAFYGFSFSNYFVKSGVYVRLCKFIEYCRIPALLPVIPFGIRNNW